MGRRRHRTTTGSRSRRCCPCRTPQALVVVKLQASSGAGSHVRGEDDVEDVVGVGAVGAGSGTVAGRDQIVGSGQRASETRKPAASSTSLPGVRIVTTNDLPPTRISSGSSTARVSGRATVCPSPRMRVTRRRVVIRPMGLR